MAGLGNVFDAVSEDPETPRGPDLKVEIEVPRSALGRAEGFVADIPEQLPLGGELVARLVEPGQEGKGIVLHLADSLPERATLRLRGHGGVCPDGAAGDLWVTIRVVEDPPRPGPSRLVVSAVVLAVLAALAAAFVFG